MIDLPSLSVLLHSFHEVARHGSVSIAADRLNVSQPTVTNRVRQLEELYGVELLHRRGSKIGLTSTGSALMPLLDQLVQQVCTIDFQLRNAGGLRSGEIRIGATGPYYILPALAAFRERFPAVTVNLQIDNSRRVIDALLDSKIDLAVSSAVIDDERLARRVLASDPVVALVYPDHPLARQSSVALAELARHRLLMREKGSMTREVTERAFREAGITPADVIEIGSREAIHVAVEHRMGCSVMSRGEIPTGSPLRAIPFLDAPPMLYEYLYFLKDREAARLVAAFLEPIQQPA